VKVPLEKNGDKAEDEFKRKKWRVVKFENRYRSKNAPFVEYPAKHLYMLVKTLHVVYGRYLEELAEAGMTTDEAASYLGWATKSLPPWAEMYGEVFKNKK